jgi:hypothetical protein
MPPTPHISLTNVNPDFYRTDIVRVGERTRTVILATVSPLTLGQLEGAQAIIDELDRSKDLTLFAVDVVLATDVDIPGGDVQIYCKRLRVPKIKRAKDDPRSGIRIDVSSVRNEAYTGPFVPHPLGDLTDPPKKGAHGDDITASLRAGDSTWAMPTSINRRFGDPGAPGGSITVVCESIELVDDLALVANGAQGFPGSNGQGGGGANTQLQGGAGGNAGKGSVGGDGGVVDVRCTTLDNLARLKASALAGRPGESGTPGDGGTPHGEIGAPAGPIASAVGGDTNVEAGVLPADAGAVMDKVFLLKLLQRCKRLYAFNSPIKFTDADADFPRGSAEWKVLREHLDWLVALLGRDYAMATDSDPRPDAVAKRDIYNDAKLLASNHEHTLTSFGRAANWVPSTTLEMMKKSFDDGWTARKALEDAFLALSASYTKEQTDQDALTTARVQVDGAVMMRFAEYLGTLEALKGVPARVTSALSGLQAATAALQQAVAPKSDFETKLTGYFKCPSIADIVKAAEMIAFTIGPEGPSAQTAIMAAVEAAGMLDEGFNKIETDDHRSVPKSDILNHIVELRGDSLKDAVQGEVLVLKEGRVVIDPKKQMLLTSLDAFEGEVRNLSQALGDDTVGGLVTAIEDFKTALLDKSESMITYHLLARRLIEQYESYLDAKDEQAKLAGKPNPLDPYRLATVNYLAQLYQAQLERTIQDVALLERKYAYVMPDKYEPVDPAQAFNGLWSDGSAPSKLDVTQLKATVDALASALVTSRGESSSSANRFPAEDERGELWVHITDKKLLDKLKNTGRIKFKTVPSGDAIDERAVVPELHVIGSDRYYDIRVSHVQPRLIGAKTTHDQVFVEMRMASQSMICGEATRYNFSYHALHGEAQHPRYASLIHRTDARLFRDPRCKKQCKTCKSGPPGGGLELCGEMSDLLGDRGNMKDEFLDTVGVFSIWELWVPKTAGDESINIGFDASGVTEIGIHFRGWRRVRP